MTDGDAHFRQESIKILHEPHRAVVERAIRRTLSTEIAEETYAQIVDGLPLLPVLFDSRQLGPRKDHPIRNIHETLCEGVRERTREIYQTFDFESLEFDSRLLLAFQAAGPGSRVFNTRLVEILAIAVHDIAVHLFKLDTSLHKNDGIVEWAPPKSDTLFWDLYPDGPPPTMFHHPWYKEHEQYPNGVADMVGYWAEGRILGGVVLFDRNERHPEAQDSEADDTNGDIYLHPDRVKVSYRIFKLLPEQKQSLVSYLSSETPPESVPIPLRSSEENRTRVDPEESIKETGIYRDIWERRDLPDSAGDRRIKDVWSYFDYSSFEDWRVSNGRAWDRKRRIDYGPDWERILGDSDYSDD